MDNRLLERERWLVLATRICAAAVVACALALTLLAHWAGAPEWSEWAFLVLFLQLLAGIAAATYFSVARIPVVLRWGAEDAGFAGAAGLGFWQLWRSQYIIWWAKPGPARQALETLWGGLADPERAEAEIGAIQRRLRKEIARVQNREMWPWFAAISVLLLAMVGTFYVGGLEVFLQWSMLIVVVAFALAMAGPQLAGGRYIALGLRRWAEETRRFAVPGSAPSA